MRKLWYQLVYIMCKPFFGWLCGFVYPIKIIHKKRLPKKQRHVVVSNHLSAIDIIHVFLQTPGRRRMIAKKELRKSKFLRVFEKPADIIWIDRENPSVASVKRILECLKKDQAVCLFPEGTRNKENRELQDLKSGATVFAIKGKAPLVPLLIFSHAKKFRRNYLYVGEPLFLEKFYNERLRPEIVEFADEYLRRHMLAEMEKMDDYVINKRWKKKNRLPVVEEEVVENIEEQVFDDMIEDSTEKISMDKTQEADKEIESKVIEQA